MKKVLTIFYTVFVCVTVLALLYFINPYVIEYPKISAVVLVLLMLTSVGAGIRSTAEVVTLIPIAKIVDGEDIPTSFCIIIFAVAMLVAIVIPWLNGVAAFSVWNWISSIGFTLFNFETFYSFICGLASVKAAE